MYKKTVRKKTIISTKTREVFHIGRNIKDKNQTIEIEISVKKKFL